MSSVNFSLIFDQFVEQKVFNVGYGYQQATDWHKKHPNLEVGG